MKQLWTGEGAKINAARAERLADSSIVEVGDVAPQFSIVTASGDEFSLPAVDQVVLVNFFATWCGPCKAIAPVMHELEETYGDSILFARCNVDQSPNTPAQYSIRAIPTLILFQGGKVIDQVIGAVPKSHLESLVNKVL